MKKQYIIIHASKIVEAPIGYDDDGEHAKPWNKLSHEDQIWLCRDEITDLDSDDWDIITYENVDSKNNPNPENIKEKKKSV